MEMPPEEAIWRKKRILVVPGTTQIAAEIVRALGPSKNYELFGAGFDESHPLVLSYLAFENLPEAKNNNYVSDLNEIISKHNIDIIYPAHDDWIEQLAIDGEKLKATIVSTGVTSSITARTKKKTFATLDGEFFLPKLFFKKSDINSYPVFIKPDKGQGAQGTKKVMREAELDEYTDNGTVDPEWIVTEYLPGAEITVDTFSAVPGTVNYLNSRVRTQAANGLAITTEMIDVPNIQEVAETISKKMELSGAWFFQMKKNSNGEYMLMEVGARIAGASGLNRALGVNLPELALLHAIGTPVEICTPLLKSDAVGYKVTQDVVRFPRPFKNVYVDFDDTVLLDENKVNAALVSFLFECRNYGAKIHLISRHKGNLLEKLLKYGLTSIFDNVIHLTKGEPKSLYVLNDESVFIDDSFKERRDVMQKCGVLSVDVSAFSTRWTF